MEQVDDEIYLLDWNRPMPLRETQKDGSRWIDSASSAILKVPSAVIQGEYNYLLNPAHPDFVKIEFMELMQYKFDPRLI